MVPNRPSYPVNVLMSATSKVAFVSPRRAASRRARSIAVGGQVETHRGHAAFGVELALFDQRGQFRLVAPMLQGGRPPAPNWAVSPR